jgi:hypothetical protein
MEESSILFALLQWPFEEDFVGREEGDWGGHEESFYV